MKQTQEPNTPQLNCFQRRNSGAGFELSHTGFCVYHPDEFVTGHVNIGYWCGNICDLCRKGKGQYHDFRKFTIEDGIHRVITTPAPRMRFVMPSTPTNTEKETNMTKIKKASKKKATKKAASKKASSRKPKDLTNQPADIQFLATYQNKTIERMSGKAVASIFRKINRATQAKPVVHASLSLYDKRLARELTRLGLVLKLDQDGIGLGYFPNPVIVKQLPAAK